MFRGVRAAVRRRGPVLRVVFQHVDAGIDQVLDDQVDGFDAVHAGQMRADFRHRQMALFASACEQFLQMVLLLEQGRGVFTHGR